MTSVSSNLAFGNGIFYFEYIYIYPSWKILGFQMDSYRYFAATISKWIAWPLEIDVLENCPGNRCSILF
jgi:hypothetical protein